MKKKIFMMMAIALATAVSTEAQTIRKMDINELFQLISENNKSIKASRTTSRLSMPAEPLMQASVWQNWV